MTSARDLTCTNIPSPQTNSACLPLINWSTKPNRKQQDTGTLDGSDGPYTVMPPADSVTDGSGECHQLALLLCHLGHSVAIVNATSQQDSANSHGVHSSVGVDNTMHELEAALHQLETAVLHLSTLDAPVVLEPCAPPGSPSYLFSSPLLNRKYYVVLKGICTSLYYGVWDDIRCLVEHVPGAVHKSFKTLEPANAFYLEAKKRGNVHYICNPGDAVRYGPDEDAVQ